MRILLALTCIILISGTALSAQSQEAVRLRLNKVSTPEGVNAPKELPVQEAVPQAETQQARKHPSREEINAQKIAFFSQELNLTPQEAEKFWPVYNESWRERSKARHETMQNLNELNKALEEDPAVSDTQIQALSDAYIKSFKREGEVYISYFNNFKKVLPLRKAVKVFSAEEKFRVILIKQLRGK